MTTYEPADWRPKPGDVAMVTARPKETTARIFCNTQMYSNYWWGPTGYVKNPSHVRRLEVVDPASVVILDPNNPDDVPLVVDVPDDYETGIHQAARDLRALVADLGSTDD